MAKRRSRRKSYARRVVRRARASFSSFKRRGRRSNSSSSMSNKGTMALVIGAAAYGAGREYVSDKLSPITSRVPLGDLADEATMGVLSYFVAKGKIPLVNKLPYSKEIGKAGLTIEAARVGAYLGAKFAPAMTSNNSSTGSW